MADSIRQYSTLFQCRYDEPRANPNLPYHYSVFRAVSAHNVEQLPTALPHVHDFAVLWDDDHDTRIIHVLEEMLMIGMLPGVQFIGEHKGELTVILAARTYWRIDTKKYAARLHKLTGLSAGDYWTVRIGMYDHSPGSLRSGHQCDFQNILGMGEEEEHAHLFAIDSQWKLGTKRWIPADSPVEPVRPGQLFAAPNRYEIEGHRPNLGPFWASGAPPVPGLVPPPPPVPTSDK
ncbi:hypothetical protein [Burkholderia cepacia]|uniref:hypothetical protein n=1 Tax=Burkholderia cepacia TaxID=292 RepID=UPI000B25BA85|nr:hypothetical protein [Burkholderia cepacia]